jgi:hypothetical protein
MRTMTYRSKSHIGIYLARWMPRRRRTLAQRAARAGRQAPHALQRGVQRLLRRVKTRLPQLHLPRWGSIA